MPSKFRIISALTVLLCLSGNLAARQSIQIDKPVNAKQRAASLFAPGKLPPFSFEFGGRSSDAFIRSWKQTRVQVETGSPTVACQDISYASPDRRMTVVCRVWTYSDFDAIEWKLTFKNNSGTNSPQITKVMAADADLRGGSGFTLYTARGSNALSSDFSLQKVALKEDSTYRYVPAGGRSSSKTAFPFYNLASEGRGVMFSIGWTGTWFADFELSEASLHLDAGMLNTDLYLLPKEEIRTPMVSMLFWSGADRIDGNNLFRRFVLAHHSPRNGKGELIQPPLSSGFDYGDPEPCNEYSGFTEKFAHAVIERQEQFNLTPEVYWLDAGWYAGAGTFNTVGKDWYNSVGSWYADSARFPHGLRPIADDVHRVGAKFMVWLEPERVYDSTFIAERHPEWLLNLKDSPQHLLNLGNPEALKWLTKYIGDFFEENGIDYYRQDFNINPDSFWAAADEPGRKGITEIRYIEGLYRYWDDLHLRFPDMLIDNCSSGGRRFDMETIGRSMPLWRTDCHYGEPNCQQCHMYGLSQFLPLSGTGIFYSDQYCMRSGLSSAYGWFGEVFSRGGNLTSQKTGFDEYRQLREYFLKDFYPLTGDDDLTAENTWIAYQLNEPTDGSGIVLAFRRPQNEDKSIEVRLRGLDRNAMYDLYDFDTKQTVRVSGSDLADGYRITIDEPRGSRLLKYTTK